MSHHTDDTTSQGDEKPALAHDISEVAINWETNLAPNLHQDLIDFHTKFGLVYEGPPRNLPQDLFEFRKKFLQEELDEYIEAEELDDREKMLDSLVDLVYVAIGTAQLHGFDFNEAWRRVQAANMAKVRCERESDSARGTTYDVIKPPGWVAPDLSDLV